MDDTLCFVVINRSTQFNPAPEKENKRIEMYKMCFEIFRKYRNVVPGVTFSEYSALDNFPARGRKDCPLLFEKLAFQKSILARGEFLEETFIYHFIQEIAI